MRQLDLISHSRADKKKPHRLRGFISSAVFHALLVTFVLELGFLYHVKLPLTHNGSVQGASVVSLETLVIVAPPAPPAPPSPAAISTPVIANVTAPRPPAMAPQVAPSPVPPEPLVAAHPIIGVPVLPGKPTTPLQAIWAKTGAAVHHETVVASSGGGVAHLRPATDKFVSSYEPGISVLPHPPYPPEARELQQTGVVRMLVQFDKAGNVSRADVAQSSGVAVLDSETRAFIRDNWHSTTYAGRSISVPVEYTLTSL